MKNELIERYVYAVVSHLPVKTQPEVEKEIENIIIELLDARCGENPPDGEDIRAVLTELGSPEELAVKYSGDENKALIGGIYLLWYKKILKLVLPIVAAVAVFASVLASFADWRSPEDMYRFVPETVASAAVGALDGAVQAFMWITVVFIVLERKKVSFGGGDFISKLRPVPDKRAQIKIYKPVSHILFHVAAAVLFLFFSFMIGFYTGATGWIPVFNEDYIRSSWYLIVFPVFFTVIREVFMLIERSYNKKTALITIITDILTGIAAVLFFSNAGVMDAVFTEKAGSLVEGFAAKEFGLFFVNFNIFILVVILFSLLLNTGISVYRALRYGKK